MCGSIWRPSCHQSPKMYPATGSYSSALAVAKPLEASIPPVMSTVWLVNNVAVWFTLGEVMLPVGTKPSCSVVEPVTPACCSSIGVREHASPARDSAKPIVSRRILQSMRGKVSHPTKRPRNPRPRVLRVADESLQTLDRSSAPLDRAA